MFSSFWSYKICIATPLNELKCLFLFNPTRLPEHPAEKQIMVVFVQMFFGHPVVMLSFISRFALVRYQIDSNKTGSNKKIGRVN